jgi:hypothetical protein
LRSGKNQGGNQGGRDGGFSGGIANMPGGSACRGAGGGAGAGRVRLIGRSDASFAGAAFIGTATVSATQRPIAEPTTTSVGAIAAGFNRRRTPRRSNAAKLGGLVISGPCCSSSFTPAGLRWPRWRGC